MRKTDVVGVIALLVLLSACALPATTTPAPSPTPTLSPSLTPLLLPSPSPTPSPTPIIHVVQPGDTLFDIAALYGTTVEAICALNELADCELIYPGDELLIPGEGVVFPSPTPTHTPTLTDTPTPAPTPTPTPTPLLTPTPTNTRVVPLPTPTVTPTPSPTSTPTYEFMYEEGSMQAAPNCGTVYLRIKVVGVGGEPVNGVTVRLQWVDFTDYKITGQGEPAGEVGFSPLGPDSYHSPLDFHIQLVKSPSDPTPRSNEKVVNFVDCATAGAFTNIKFVYKQ